MFTQIYDSSGQTFGLGTEKAIEETSAASSVGLGLFASLPGVAAPHELLSFPCRRIRVGRRLGSRIGPLSRRVQFSLMEPISLE